MRVLHPGLGPEPELRPKLGPEASCQSPWRPNLKSSSPQSLWRSVLALDPVPALDALPSPGILPLPLPPCYSAPVQTACRAEGCHQHADIPW